MTTEHHDMPWLGPEFFENQERIRPESLLPYAGQHIAWSWDGITILASAETHEGLYEKLKEAGIDSSRVVFDYITPPGLVNF